MLYDWSSNVETFFIDDDIVVKFRDEKKNVTEFITKRAYNEMATFALVGEKAKTFVNTMKNTSRIQIIINGTYYEKDTKYNASFEYDPNEFCSLLEKVGWE